jgi:hypothetical protein
MPIIRSGEEIAIENARNKAGIREVTEVGMLPTTRAGRALN